MVKRAKKKNLVYIFVLSTLSLLIGFNFLCPFISFAAEEYVCFANMNSSITYTYSYKNYNNFDTISKDYPENIAIPVYGNHEDESKTIVFSYNEVSFGGGFTDIVLDEITFDINFLDCILYDSTQYRFQVEYSMSPGRRTKLSLKGLEEGFITVYTNQEHTESYTVDFSDIDLITEKITQPNVSSYNYSLDFTIEPKKGSIIYGVDVVTSNILVEQDLMTTTGNSVIIGLNKAVITGFNQDEANQNNSQYLQDESNRIDDELNDLASVMVVPTPDPGNLSDQADPFSIVDGDTFSSFGSIFRPIVDSPIVAGSISLGCIFMLISYVFFGKR